VKATLRTGEGSPTVGAGRTATPAVSFTGVILVRDGNPYLPVSAKQAARLRPGWRRMAQVRRSAATYLEKAMHVLSGKACRCMASVPGRTGVEWSKRLFSQARP
jgi:hypothetical protein